MCVCQLVQSVYTVIFVWVGVMCVCVLGGGGDTKHFFFVAVAIFVILLRLYIAERPGHSPDDGVWAVVCEEAEAVRSAG